MAMPAQPPGLLQIHREALNAGAGAAYDAIETETARLRAVLGCPHPYLALTTVNGSPEVWFLNGFDSPAEQQRCLRGSSSGSDTRRSMRRVASAAEWIKPAAFEECVKTCVKDGSDAVFVTEDNKILTFDKASVAKVTLFLGRTVSVTGNVNARTLKVDGITGLEM